MRIARALTLTLLTASCGDKHDMVAVDAPTSADAAVADGSDSATGDGIAAARAAADGTGLSLPITGVTVTYLKPQIGSTTNDPAGFTIQHDQLGPGLFVSVDPTTLSPAPVVGDVVSFTITEMTTVGMQRRASAITAYSRHSQGANVGALVQNLSTVTDLVTAVDDYDSELVTITGTLGAMAASGQGFQRGELATAGITGDANLQLRAPQTLTDAIDMVQGCAITASNVPVGRFDAQAQIGAYVASDLVLASCPPPAVASAVALSSTSVRVTFTRHVLASSVMTDGSQFTFDNGLVASAAAVNGRTVTITTTAQTPATTFTITVATTVTDLLGAAVATPVSAQFAGYVQPAVVKINEVNATIANGCDLIELRVTAGGSMAGFKLTERTGDTAAGELSYTFPALAVATGDLVVVHMSSGSATCNPGAATQETTTKTDQPAATFMKNYDTAFDLWSADAGLIATDNVFTLRDATDAIVEALFVSNDPNGATTAAATETAAAAVGAANQWDPAQATYLDAVFRMNAVDDLDATGTTSAGTSIQRVNDIDTNRKTDWTTGSGAAQTFGALNAGQSL